MNEEEQQHHGNGPDGSDPSHPLGGNKLNQLRARASAFHAAADAAIENALSGNSAQFNHDARQNGGQ